MTPQELKDARKRLGLTQSQLAAKLGLSEANGDNTVRKWEAGSREISGPVAVAIAYMLRDLTD